MIEFGIQILDLKIGENNRSEPSAKDYNSTMFDRRYTWTVYWMLE